MDNDDLELYNLLIKLKNKIQNDSNSARKPVICSDESLKLMAKYRPMTLKEMDNVSRNR